MCLHSYIRPMKNLKGLWQNLRKIFRKNIPPPDRDLGGGLQVYCIFNQSFPDVSREFKTFSVSTSLLCILCTEATRMTFFIKLAFKQLFLRVKSVFKVRDRVFLYTRKRFDWCNNRESNVKSYGNLGNNCGNSTIFQFKRPPNSRTVRVILLLMFCV